MLALSARAPDHPSSQNQHRHADHHTSFEHNVVTKCGSIYSCVLRFQGGCVLGSQLLQRSLQRLALESCDRIHLRSRGRPPPPHVKIPQACARQGMIRTLALTQVHWWSKWEFSAGCDAGAGGTSSPHLKTLNVGRATTPYLSRATSDKSSASTYTKRPANVYTHTCQFVSC